MIIRKKLRKKPLNLGVKIIKMAYEIKDMVNKYVIVLNNVYFILELEELPEYKYKIKYRTCTGKDKGRVSKENLSLRTIEIINDKEKYDDLAIAVLRIGKEWKK